MSPSRSAVARFAAVRTVSLAAKVGALALFLVLLIAYLGGHL